jgi:hypothetical protein
MVVEINLIPYIHSIIIYNYINEGDSKASQIQLKKLQHVVGLDEKTFLFTVIDLEGLIPIFL